MVQLLNGQKSPMRASLASAGELTMTVNDGDEVKELTFTAFRKTTLTYAVRMPREFAVDTLEGVHTGKAGDWLAVGAEGEMYPIDAEVFAKTYVPATAHDEEKHGAR